MADIKWIKLSVNMFDDEKIKLIRTMPEGDRIIVIWVQMLCMAGKTNDGGAVYMGQNLYYTDEMLATICDQPVNIMRLALQTLEQFGMIERQDYGLIEIYNWEKHQNIEGMEKIREQNRVRKQRQREKNQSKLNNSVTSRDSHATDKNRLDKIRLEESKDILSGSDEPDRVPYSEIIDHLNEKTSSQYRASGQKTKTLIKTRFTEGFTIDDFKKVIDIKTDQWIKDSNMSKYLRPETLFGTKFESYLNEDKGGNPDGEFDFFA